MREWGEAGVRSQAHQRGVLEGTFGLAWAQQTGTGASLESNPLTDPLLHLLRRMCEIETARSRYHVGAGVEANLTAARELYTAALAAAPSDAERVGLWVALRLLSLHQLLHALRQRLPAGCAPCHAPQIMHGPKQRLGG
jgi:hypothetical protein